jgi:hypothetical protein
LHCSRLHKLDPLHDKHKINLPILTENGNFLFPLYSIPVLSSPILLSNEYTGFLPRG